MTLNGIDFKCRNQESRQKSLLITPFRIAAGTKQKSLFILNFIDNNTKNMNSQ